MQDNSKTLKKLRTIIKSKGLNHTKQREIIFKTILECDTHLNADELYSLISQQYPSEKIGIATIYRALAFLEECELISSISLDNNSKKFESIKDKHHDHLICIKCNAIVEFLDEEIEARQDKIANNHGFKLLNHTMYLYGLCQKCSLLIK